MSGWMKFGNRAVAWLARSPLHGLISGGVLVLEVVGKKSGKLYTVPVNYQEHGDRLLIVSMRRRSWWRNLVDGAEIVVWWRGEQRRCRAQAFMDESAVLPALEQYLAAKPALVDRYQLPRDSRGQVLGSALAEFSRQRVVVWLSPYPRNRGRQG